MMMLIVAGVGSLIVAYSVGYMDGEDEERRYFAYMSLFVFSMLLLVQGGNLLLLLAGWGMVGLSSYLLIGFHQDRPSAIAAAKKAFIMNAFGDATMALALFLLIQHTGQLDYAGVFAASPARRRGREPDRARPARRRGREVARRSRCTRGCPDAMEGPTPVSALIHAATMVTAGVYLIVRCHPLFENAYVIQDLAAGLGAATLLMAGLIALVQTDIKRVIAYSTMSQIGYMFVGAGLGAYPSGDVPPDDACVLQGAALHVGRARDPCGRRRAGHPQARRHREADAVHEDRLPDRLARARRHPTVRRLLLEGLDHRRRRSTAAGTGS